MNNPPDLSVLKQFNKKIVRVGSSTRTNNSSSFSETNDLPTNYTVSFNSTGQELSKIKKIGMTMFSTNNLFYNVASYNSRMILLCGGGFVGEVVINITPNFYNATELAAAITAYVVANYPSLPSFTCTFSTTTYLFTLDSGDAGTVMRITNKVVNPVSNSYINTLAYNLGYTYFPFGNPGFTPSQTLVANSLPSLNIQNIYIFSDKLASTKAFRSDYNNRSVQGNELIAISLHDIAYGSTVNFTSTGSNEKGTIIYPIELQLDTIDIQLLNESGNVLECPYNNNNILEFTIYY